MADDHQKLYRDLLARGLEIAQQGGHLKITDGERLVVAPVSPSDHRGLTNLKAELVRAGFIEKQNGGAGKRGRRPEVPQRPYEGPRRPFGRVKRDK